MCVTAVVRSCVFCGSTPTTKEHVWPLWTRRLFPVPTTAELRPHHIQYIVLNPDTRQAGMGRESRGRSSPAVDMVVKVVCRSCNNGWMSQLESAVQQPLTAMMRDLPAAPSPEQWAQISLWAAKTAAMVEFHHPPTRAMTDEQVRYLYEQRAPAPETQVWAGMSKAKQPRLLLHHGIYFSEKRTLPSPPPSMNTHVTAIIAGHMIIFVWCSTVFDQEGLSPKHHIADKLIQLSPALAARAWPPAMPALDDNAIKALTRELVLDGSKGTSS